MTPSRRMLPGVPEPESMLLILMGSLTDWPLERTPPFQDTSEGMADLLQEWFQDLNSQIEEIYQDLMPP